MLAKTLKNLLLCSIISSSPIIALAQQDTTHSDSSKISQSISYLSNTTLSKDKRKKLIDEANVDVSNTQLISALAARSANTAARHNVDFSIFDASTVLISDDDYDGFYHRFAVTIDADTVFSHAPVYADVYLSFEGGPWIYYASSQTIDLHYDNSNDAFTIETELADGYPTGYYDMKIELYDAVTDEYLMTYNNYDDSSLSAIPLEDAYRDDDRVDYYPRETEVVVAYGAGSMNVLSLLSLVFLSSGIRLWRTKTV